VSLSCVRLICELLAGLCPGLCRLAGTEYAKEAYRD
jgi:hypothetical protein